MTTITVAAKKALVAAHKNGTAKSSENGMHLKLLSRLIAAGLLTGKYQITRAGLVAIGVKPAPQPRKLKITPVQFEGVIPLGRYVEPRYPVSYATH